MMLGKRQAVDIPLLSDIGVFLMKAYNSLPTFKRVDVRNDIREQKEAWRAVKTKRAEKEEPIHPALIFMKLSELAPEDAVITVDVGNNAYSFGKYFECKNQEIVLSGYLGSIGFAFPAAIGASFARPDKKIIAVAGDGGFGQYLGEFLTAVHYNLPITLILLNNSELAKISNEQRSEHFPLFSTNLTNPNFAKYAELCGGKGIRVAKKDEVTKALVEGLNSTYPTIIEFLTDPLEV